jgi:hypothetical protein
MHLLYDLGVTLTSSQFLIAQTSVALTHILLLDCY